MAEKQGFVPENYNPVEYWNARNQPNTAKNPGISAAHAAYFALHAKPGATILELGPGIGRLFPMYRSAKDRTFSTVDIASQHKDTVDAAAQAQGLKVQQFFMNEADARYPFADDSFDIGVSSYVFIHVPFEYIRHAMLEMARVARKTIIFATDNPLWAQSPADRKPSSHCFNHDYAALCDAMGLTLFDSIRFPKAKDKDITPTAFVFGKA